MNLITPRIRHIAARCHPSDTDWAIAQLQTYCDYLSEFYSDERKPDSFDRICCAILKLGGTSREKFTQALELGRTDDRDVLVAAGFGNSTTVHNEWATKMLDKET